MRKLRHKIELGFNMDPTENVDEHRFRQCSEEYVTGKLAANCAVEQWRMPHTLCTLSWNDGRIGRGYATFRKDAMSDADRAKASEAGIHGEWSGV